MNIIYQYYNEISLGFNGYDTDFHEGTIVIYVAEDNRPFSLVCEKIDQRLVEIAKTLNDRDVDVVVEIRRTGNSKTVVLAHHFET